MYQRFSTPSRRIWFRERWPNATDMFVRVFDYPVLSVNDQANPHARPAPEIDRVALDQKTRITHRLFSA